MHTLTLAVMVVVVVSAGSVPWIAADHSMLNTTHVFRNSSGRSYDRYPFRKQVIHHENNQGHNNTSDIQQSMNLKRHDRTRNNDSQPHDSNENLTDIKNNKQVPTKVLNSHKQDSNKQNDPYVNKTTSDITNNTVVKSLNSDEKVMNDTIENKVKKRVSDNNQEAILKNSNKKSEVTKATNNNEATPRTGVKKQKVDDTDRWIWESGDDVVVTTGATDQKTLDDRNSFNGDNCPTDSVKVNGMCVPKD